MYVKFRYIFQLNNFFKLNINLIFFLYNKVFNYIVIDGILFLDISQQLFFNSIKDYADSLFCDCECLK